MYTPSKVGAGDYNHYGQLSTSQVNTLTAQEGLNSIDLKHQKFAVLTYQVNPTPIEISGGLTIGDIVIKGGTSGVKADVTSDNKLFVIDEDSLAAIHALTSDIQDVRASVNQLSAYIINSQDQYSRVIKDDGTYTYIMQANPGTPSGSTGWRIKRIDGDGSLMWPSGDNTFSFIASDYLTVSYSL